MVDNTISGGSAETLQSWLDIHGFKANPFAHQEAAGEEGLGQYFVSPSYFDEIQGDAYAPRTSFVFAPRGSGKTAMCMMIEEFCRASLAGKGKILAVPYTDFMPVVETVQGDLAQVTPRLQVEEILKHGVMALTWLLQHHAGFAQHARQILSQGERILLQWYLSTHGHRLSPGQSSFLWEELGFRIHVGSEPLEKAGSIGGKEKVQGDKTKQEEIPMELAILLADRAQISPVQLLRDFVELVRRLGVNAVYVLVDGVDELLETALDAEAASQLLAPLTASLRLLDMPHLAFKFFLPTEIMDCLLEQGKVRPDRVLIREIRWGEEELMDILRQRLRAFNRLGYDSLAPACVPELRNSIDQDLVKLAKWSPRNLLRLGELLFSEHCRGPGAADLEINKETWMRAQERWISETADSAELSWRKWGEEELPQPIVVPDYRFSATQ